MQVSTDHACPPNCQHNNTDPKLILSLSRSPLTAQTGAMTIPHTTRKKHSSSQSPQAAHRRAALTHSLTPGQPIHGFPSRPRPSVVSFVRWFWSFGCVASKARQGTSQSSSLFARGVVLSNTHTLTHSLAHSLAHSPRHTHTITHFPEPFSVPQSARSPPAVPHRARHPPPQHSSATRSTDAIPIGRRPWGT